MFRPAPIAPPPLPLLLTGLAGVAGFAALDYFQKKHPGQVIGIQPSETPPLLGPDLVTCDTDDRDAMRRLFDHYQFRSVLDCAGSCALKPCELNPEMAWRINVAGIRDLLEQTVPRGIRLVHLSIDLVFSGTSTGGHVEEDPTDPVTVYGKTMVEGERLVLERDPGACILRISLPMGVSLNGHAGAVDWIASRFRKNRPATLYYDEVRTPTYVDCMNRVFQRVLASDLAGIYHAGGPRRLSLYQIAQIVNRVGGYDPDLLFGLPRFHAGPIPPRAGDVTMDSSRLARDLGYEPFDPWPLDDAWVPTHRDWHRERPHGEERSEAMLHRVLCLNPAMRGASS